MVGERKVELDKLLVVCSSVYLNEDKDLLVWLLTRCGHFSSSSTYPSIQHCEILPYMFLWKVKVSLWVKTFIRLAPRERIWTRYVMLRREGECSQQCLGQCRCHPVPKLPLVELAVAWWWCPCLVFRMAMASLLTLALGWASSSFNGLAPLVAGRGNREPLWRWGRSTMSRLELMSWQRCPFNYGLFLPKVLLVFLRGGLLAMEDFFNF